MRWPTTVHIGNGNEVGIAAAWMKVMIIEACGAYPECGRVRVLSYQETAWVGTQLPESDYGDLGSSMNYYLSPVIGHGGGCRHWMIA